MALIISIDLQNSKTKLANKSESRKTEDGRPKTEVAIELLGFTSDFGLRSSDYFKYSSYLFW